MDLREPIVQNMLINLRHTQSIAWSAVSKNKERISIVSPIRLKEIITRKTRMVIIPQDVYIYKDLSPFDLPPSVWKRVNNPNFIYLIRYIIRSNQAANNPSITKELTLQKINDFNLDARGNWILSLKHQKLEYIDNEFLILTGYN